MGTRASVTTHPISSSSLVIRSKSCRLRECLPWRCALDWHSKRLCPASAAAGCTAPTANIARTATLEAIHEGPAAQTQLSETRRPNRRPDLEPGPSNRSRGATNPDRCLRIWRTSEGRGRRAVRPALHRRPYAVPEVRITRRRPRLWQAAARWREKPSPVQHQVRSPAGCTNRRIAIMPRQSALSASAAQLKQDPTTISRLSSGGILPCSP